MDIFLSIVGILLLLAGFAGSIVPGVPGPPLAWASLLPLHYSTYAEYSWFFLVASGIIMVTITILDFYIPVWGTKKFGGTRAGVIGSTIGLLAGMFFFPPFGVLIGPFLGALIGELIADQKDFQKALKSAFGSFIGFLAGTLVKLGFCVVMAFYFFKELFSA